MKTVQEKDQKHCWHPFTQHLNEADPIIIASAKESCFYDDSGKKYLDLISSWWTCLHGHAHPALIQALHEQASEMAHVMFAGFTHRPAAELSSSLADLLPGGLNRVFFSDNGSTAIEVAMKLAFQYWQNTTNTRRSKFLCFEGGYHGDTLGAMSVGRGNGFFKLYEDMMCETILLPFPDSWEGDEDIVKKEERVLTQLKKILEQQASEITALLIEPLMQGAGGMRFCRPEFLQQLVLCVQNAGILVIFDEVATGFGRTGKMFALEYIDQVPDLVCLSKGITGGYMPLSVTVAQDYIFDAFLGDTFSSALPHGHSYTANPLGCAIANRSLKLFSEEGTLQKIENITRRHREFMLVLKDNPMIEKIRLLGTVLAFDLKGSGSYKSKDSLWIRDWFLEKGLNIRPLGNVIYLFPPYCITDGELDEGYRNIVLGLEALSHKRSAEVVLSSRP